jgi:alanyl-tRNA synthetase
MYFDRGEDFGCGGKNCGPNCPNCQRFVELWNLVFMEYNKERDGKYVKLPKKNVDTGIGFERLVTILQNKESTYETDLFLPLIQRAENLSDKTYREDKKSFRIVVDHIRGAAFLISEGVFPDNLGRGYVLRRILRRSIKYAKVLGLKDYWYVPLIKETIKIYERIYPEVRRKETDIISVVQKEEEKFKKTLGKGLVQFEKLLKIKIKEQKSKIIEGKEVFDLYQSYGFPMELTKELAEEKGFQVDEKDFQKKFKQHQKISRTGVKRKFGGHGIEKNGIEEEKKKIIKLHTATHLLQAALRQILGKEVKQRGSDINRERLRFDFSYNRKVTPEEIKKVEDLVNQKIKKNLEVREEEMSLERAINSGALSFFKEKYSNVVKVYTIFDPEITEIFSKEICGGPHVKKTSELGIFQITKEESSGANTRRIKAILK